MLTQHAYEYAVVRVVPCVAREEFVNAGIILLCRDKRFLRAHVGFCASRLLALNPGCDLESIRQHLQVILNICAGEGPLADLNQVERFRWLIAPDSASIQTSDVHCGLCQDPAARLKHLFQELVLLPSRATHHADSSLR